jgi:hypothetical protein
MTVTQWDEGCICLFINLAILAMFNGWSNNVLEATLVGIHPLEIVVNKSVEFVTRKLLT